MLITLKEVLSLVEPIIAPRQLNKIQQLVLYHCWQGLSYQEIADNIDYDLGYVKDTGSSLWQLLSKVTGEKINKQNVRATIKNYLGQKERFSSTTSQHDWGDVIALEIFYGREQELATLTKWTREDKCRLIAISGIGGVGKTLLTAKLAEEIQKDFDYIFWRSLRDTPSFKELSSNLLQFFSRENSPLPETESGQLLELQKCLKSVRALIILDNFDALFEKQQPEIIYQESYQEYGELLRQVGETPHQSCLVITTRETPPEISLLQGLSLPVRQWRLTGLENKAAQQLLATKGIKDSPEALDSLVQAYQGNPLALKMIASSIQNLFGGDVQAFLKQNVLLIKGIRHLIKSQIEKLSDLEKQVMYWLAINREAVSLIKLQEDIFPSPSLPVLLEALESLLERSLIERTKEGFTQQPVIMEYITEQLITQVADELLSGSFVFLNHYALLKATAKDYISQSQISTIIKPLLTQVVLRLKSQQLLSTLLKQHLEQIHSKIPVVDGYTLGNLLNLSNFLELDLTGLDFSHLTIWQADLRKTKLEQVNFAQVNISRSVFAQTFGGVSCVVFSPSGKLLATSDTSGEVQIWTLTNFQQLHTIKADLVWTWAVIFSQDEKLLLTAGDDYVIKVWEVQTGQCLGKLEGHTNTINALTLHPQGDILASCSLDTTIRLWSVQDFNQASRILAGHQQRVWSVSFSPDGSTLVSGSEDLTLKLWNVETGECLRTLEGHTHWIKSVAFSPVGKTIASGSFDGVIKLWSADKCLKSLQAHQSTITTVTYSPDGLSLASSSYDQTVKVWDLNLTKCIKTLTEHNNRVWSVSYSPNGRYLATGGDDNATRLWHLKNGNCAKTWKGHSNKILFLAFNNQNNLVATAQEDQTVNIWNLESGNIIKVLRGHKNRIWSVAFSPKNSSLLASGSADRTLKLWQTETGECLKTLHGHQSWVWSVIFSLDGSQLISSSYDQTIKFWDLESGECLQTMQGHNGPVVSLSVSPDGRYLASGSFDSTVKLWDLHTGQCINTFTAHQKSVWPVVFSPDGRYLASGSYDSTIKIWEVATGNCLQTLSGHSTSVMSLAFSDKQLVSGSFDKTIKLWDIETGECLRTLEGHSGLVSALVSNLSKNVLISSSFDETIRLWDLQTGQCLSTFLTPRPYDGLNIQGARGLTENQKVTLKALGAVETSQGL